MEERSSEARDPACPLIPDLSGLRLAKFELWTRGRPKPRVVPIT